MFNRMKLKRELNQLYKKRDKLLKQLNFNIGFELNQSSYLSTIHQIGNLEWEIYDVNNRIIKIGKMLNLA